MKRFLIIQLACFGDCLYATTVAKQIKHDNPYSHLTWAIATKYSSAIHLNPDVDCVWEIDIKDGDYYNRNLEKLIVEANIRKKEGEFNEIIITQIPDYNWHNFNGTIRGSLLKNSRLRITVPVEPVVHLSENEISRVRQYVRDNNLRAYKKVVLFECAPSSGQSFINPEMALEIAEIITSRREDICIILSSPYQLKAKSSHVKDASSLSIRENAELANFCTHFVGCSSGITWLCSSSWVKKKLPTIQFLSESCKWYAGMTYDHALWGLPHDHIVEVLDCSPTQAGACILSLVDDGIGLLKNKYKASYKPQYKHFEEVAKTLLNSNSSYHDLLYYFIGFSSKTRHLNKFRLAANLVGFIFDFKCIHILRFIKSKAKRLKEVLHLGEHNSL